MRLDSEMRFSVCQFVLFQSFLGPCQPYLFNCQEHFGKHAVQQLASPSRCLSGPLALAVWPRVALCREAPVPAVAARVPWALQLASSLAPPRCAPCRRPPGVWCRCRSWLSSLAPPWPVPCRRCPEVVCRCS